MPVFLGSTKPSMRREQSKIMLWDPEQCQLRANGRSSAQSPYAFDPLQEMDAASGYRFGAAGSGAATTSRYAGVGLERAVCRAVLADG
jgi:hypothetical protein